MSVETIWIEGAPRLRSDVSGEGATVLFMHGIGGNRSNWRDQLEALQGFRATAFDARGYGESEDVDGPRRFTDFADDAVRVLDAVGADRAHVVGLSMGGRVAFDLWRRYSDRLISMTIADSSAGSRETQDPQVVDAFLAARAKPLLEGRTPADIAPQVAAGLLGASASDTARAQIVASLAALRTEPYLKTLEAVTRFTDFPDLADIDVPVQIIVGSEDKVAPPHVMRAMADAIPGSRYAEIEGAGHLSNIEAPDVFNAILRAFLEDIA